METGKFSRTANQMYALTSHYRAWWSHSRLMKMLLRIYWSDRHRTCCQWSCPITFPKLSQSRIDILERLVDFISVFGTRQDNLM